MKSHEIQPEFTSTRDRQSAASSTASRPPEERRVVAWVGKSVIFTGELISSEDITVDGRVEGTIEVRNHALTVGPDADIRADIIARTVTVLGSVTGSIIAHEKVDIRETGALEGDIVSPRLAMADGAILRGRVETNMRGAEQAVPTPNEPLQVHSA
jgi:cytoskeletal protein CcmA (bactofilin family)